ncbi:hypothetical protein MWN34_15110 [Ancylobacter sp. 6x-1]|uniref:Strictosidine synthase conserved region domain-containing protein n=1 Tax=Ancylobacter crimeensis TaxID=2579147 RepID=A0ABT0DEQ5_9HYPH|nr:hypothetical protein [Ancylobacter crimeensis]MCK0198242.1 hypothetical protein [Ancylobacter crimeensis]
MTILDPLLDLFRGKAVTVPPLDGAFRPNRLLDEASALTSISEPTDLAVKDGRTLVASGNAVHALKADGSTEVVESFTAPVTALAVSPTGALAVALDSGRLFVDGTEVKLPDGINCLIALSYAANGILLIANGSFLHRPTDWRRDMMEKNAAGSVWALHPDGTTRRLADGLAWPSGVLADGAGVVVAEAWQRRLVRIADGRSQVLVSNMPGYPARMSRAGEGVLLAVFAPVNRLIEFVLQEDDYRRAMMAEIPPDYWIAPALASGNSFLEPLQCGGIKTMGIHKPWSPSRSYGLLVRLDRGFQPVASYHSRADGRRHGVVAAVTAGGAIHVACAGGGEILALDA